MRRATNASATARSRAIRGTRTREVEDEDRAEAEEGDSLQEEGEEVERDPRARDELRGERPGATQQDRQDEDEDETDDPAARLAHRGEEERRPDEEGGPEPDRLRREDGECPGSGHRSRRPS